MLQLKTDHAAVEEGTLEGLEAYTHHLVEVRKGASYAAQESSLNLPADEALLREVKRVADQKAGPKLKYSIVVGIGGSNLGAKAIYDALYGYRDLMEPARFPKMLFAETTDPEWLASALQLIDNLSDPQEVLVTLISKSGSTLETVANFEIIMQALRAKFEGAESRVVAVTGEGSALWDQASSLGLTCLQIPEPVGGRYSVLSAAGLLPLLSVGVDIVQLRQGANAVLDRYLGGDDSMNMAARSAAVLFSHNKQGYTINDNFFFHPELESVGKWYRQLLGESVGKKESLDGQMVHTGITPTVSLGSTDLHSVGQLYLGGPKDKLTTFVSCGQYKPVSIPAERMMPELIPMIHGKSAADIMTAILEGVKTAYQKAGLPFMEVTLDALNEQSLGAFLQFKMLEMMYLGKLFNVNSFDQPSVEDYKVETKRLLEAQS